MEKKPYDCLGSKNNLAIKKSCIFLMNNTTCTKKRELQVLIKHSLTQNFTYEVVIWVGKWDIREYSRLWNNHIYLLENLSNKINRYIYYILYIVDISIYYLFKYIFTIYSKYIYV